MDVSVAIEHRFLRSPDGAVWTQTQFALSFWQLYLSVFDRVRVVARVLEAPEAPADWKRADGAQVSFDCVPHYLGPTEYVRRSLAVQRSIRGAVRTGEAFVLRVPGNLGFIAYHRLRAEGRPFGIEVVTDPWDIFSPGAIRHPLRPFFRWQATRMLRKVCGSACAASYVTDHALQRRYPTTASTVAASSVELSDQSFVSMPRPVSYENAFTLITVGSFEHLIKAPDVLLEAVARALGAGLDLRLVLVGDGKYRAAMEELAGRLGIRGRTEFTGQLTAGDQVRERLDGADLFVLPSRLEGLPRAMVEAMARGLPCVGSTAGGIPELLPDDELVPPGDAGALAQKIQEILTDPERMARMSARNLAKAHGYHESVLRRRRRLFYEQVEASTREWLRIHGR